MRTRPIEAIRRMGETEEKNAAGRNLLPGGIWVGKRIKNPKNVKKQ